MLLSLPCVKKKSLVTVDLYRLTGFTDVPPLPVDQMPQFLPFYFVVEIKYYPTLHVVLHYVGQGEVKCYQPITITSITAKSRNIHTIHYILLV